MIDLLDIKPHQVSRDMRGYTVFFYGEVKSGKTSTASKFPKSLICAFEKGYSALPGVMATPINSWGEFRKVLRQLKEPAVQERFETVVIDTCDVAYDYCEKYICNLNGVDAINKVPYGGGFTQAGKEFDECLRLIVQLNYGLVLISHATDKTFTNEQGVEYNKIVPTLGNKPRNIVSRLCDIVGYSRAVENSDGTTTTKLFMRGTPRFMAGSRFKYTPDYIDFTYQNLVDAINDAIDKQMQEDGIEYFTDDRVNVYTDTSLDLDFDALMTEFNNIIATLMDSEGGNPAFFGPRVTQIVEKYLGKGKKVSEASRDMVEQIDLIVTELKDMVNKK